MLSSWILYGIVILLALVMGTLYNFLIKDIGHLEAKHHLLAAVIIPLIALANVLVMVLAGNKLIAQAQINNEPHNAVIMALVFAVSFILPVLVNRLKLHLSKEEN